MRTVRIRAGFTGSLPPRGFRILSPRCRGLQLLRVPRSLRAADLTSRAARRARVRASRIGALLTLALAVVAVAAIARSSNGRSVARPAVFALLAEQPSAPADRFGTDRGRPPARACADPVRDAGQVPRLGGREAVRARPWTATCARPSADSGSRYIQGCGAVHARSGRRVPRPAGRRGREAPRVRQPGRRRARA